MELGLFLILGTLFVYVAKWFNLGSGLVFVVGFLGMVIGLFLSRRSWRGIFNRSNIAAIGVCLPIVISTAMVLSPLVRETVINNFRVVWRVSTTDYFKHLYTISVLKDNTFPPVHPFFSGGSYSYYLGYYLLPSSVSAIGANQGMVLYLYVLITGICALLILIKVMDELKFKWWIKVVVTLLIVFGMGWDIWPTILDNRNTEGKLIELWSITHDLGLRIDNPYVSFLWTPQHFLAAAIAVSAWIKLWRSKFSRSLLTISLWWVSISSVFVAIVMWWGLGIIYLKNKMIRKDVIFCGIIALILAAPMFLLLGARDGVFSFYIPKSFEFFKNLGRINYLITGVVEYGLVMVILPIAIYIWARKFFWWGILIGGVPIIATWFIRSVNYNDFALRGTLLIQLAAVIVFGWILNRSKVKARILLLLTSVITLAGSVPGWGYEMVNRWRENRPFEPEISEILVPIRHFHKGDNLMVYGREEWIYMTPSMGWRPVLTSSLYDSGYYLDSEGNKKRQKLEVVEKEVFENGMRGNSLEELRRSSENNLNKFTDYLSLFKADWLVIKKTESIKKGINPWGIVFENMGIKSEKVSANYLAIDIDDAIYKFRNKKLFVENKAEKLVVTDREVVIPVGLGIIGECDNDGKGRARLELDDYYVLYETNLKKEECVGKLFYIEKGGKVKMTIGSTAKELVYFKVNI